MRTCLLRSWVLLAGAASILPACGGNDETAQFPDGNGGSGATSDASTDGAGGTSGSGGSGGSTGGSGGTSGSGGSTGGSGGSTGGAGGSTGGTGGGTGGTAGTTHVNCGWDPGNNWYACGFQGEDPTQSIPIDCPTVPLVPNGDCGPIEGFGCCDEKDDNWFCSQGVLVRDACTGAGGTGGGTGGTGGATGGTGGGTGGSGGTTTEETITCGNASCSIPGEFCCLMEPSSGGPQCISYMNPQACMGITVECDSPADCPGNEVCCGAWNGSAYTQVECRSSCQGVLFCDPAIDNYCTWPNECQQSGLLPGYFVCR